MPVSFAGTFLHTSYASPIVFFDLPLSFEIKEKISISEREKLFIQKDYISLIRKGYPQEENEEEIYLFMRSLYLLEDWNTIIEYEKKIKKTHLYYPYIAFYTMQAFFKKKLFAEALFFYEKNQKFIEQIPFPEEVSEIYEQIIAQLEKIEKSKHKGDYYYYRYLIKKADSFLLLAIQNKSEKAIKTLNIKNYKKIIPVTLYSKIAPLLEEKNPLVAAYLYTHLKQNHKAGLLFFKSKQYDDAAYYLDKKSLEYALSLLAKKTATENEEKKAYENLEISAFFLAYFYLHYKQYDTLLNLLKKKYLSGFLRPIILDYLEDKKYKELLSFLEDFIKLPLIYEEKLMAYYWLGFSYLQQNQEKKGQEILFEIASRYPFSFYGYMAYRVLENSQKKGELALEWKKHYENTKNKLAEFIKNQNNAVFPKECRKALFFIKIREIEKGLREWNTTGKNMEDYLFLFALFYKQIERSDLEIEHYWKFYKKIIELSDTALFYQPLFTHFFPQKYIAPVLTISKEKEVDPIVISAIIRQESAYYEKAVSWAGATGLMQLMPSTAKPILNALFASKKITDKNLFNPFTNIYCGISYYEWLYHRVYKNIENEEYRTILSIASYNAGPTRIKKHYENFSSKENLVFFIESIPLFETRDYVKRVLLYREIYKILYAEEWKK